MQHQLTYIKLNNFEYDIFLPNEKRIGRFVQDVDGFFYFQLDQNISHAGYWSDNTLLELGQVLKEMNSEWSESLERMFT